MTDFPTGTSMPPPVIDPQEVEWIPSSTADPVGRVLRWNGGIYRAITYEATPFLQELFRKGIVQGLISKGLLVETEVASISVKGFGLVLSHRPIRFPSYPFEWCAEMFRDAAILICELGLELNSLGLELKDGHPWNVMFDGCQPRLIDIGSIVPAPLGGSWRAANEFVWTFLYPIHCMAADMANEVRNLLRYELNEEAFRMGVLHLLPWRRKLMRVLNKTHFPRLTRTVLFDELIADIRNVKFMPPTTEWSSYATGDAEYFLPFQPSHEWPTKQITIYEKLSELQPRSLVDIGCNIGWYSELAARQGWHILALDIDEPSITSLFERAKSQHLPIHTVLVDFVKATPSNITWPGASERFNADMVLALALVHHLVFKRYLHFDVIVRELSKYTKRWLLVEFVPPDDPHVKPWVTSGFDWYTLDNFLLVLRRHFQSVEVLESTPEPRKLVFCQA